MQETLRTQGSKEVTRNRGEPLEPQGKQGTLRCQHSPSGPKESRVHYGASTTLQVPRKAGYTMVPAQGSRNRASFWSSMELPKARDTRNARRAAGGAFPEGFPECEEGGWGSPGAGGPWNASRGAEGALGAGSLGMQAEGLGAYRRWEAKPPKVHKQPNTTAVFALRAEVAQT